MKSKQDQLQELFDNYINGNYKEMVANIDEYGRYDIWEDLWQFIKGDELTTSPHQTFIKIVQIDGRIKNR